MKGAGKDFSCNHCGKPGHTITTCQRFIVLPLAQRMDQVIQQKLCLNCLFKGHYSAQCTSKYTCRFCKQRHHSLLHEHNTEEIQQIPSSTTASTHGTFNNISEPKACNIILATAIVLIQDSEGKYQMGRALLDSCSQVNFISNKLCRSLNMKKSKNTIDVVGIGSTGFKVPFKTQTMIRSRLNNFQMSLEFLVSQNISGYHPDEISQLRISIYRLI